MTYAQRLRKLADSTGLDAFGDEIRAIADEMDAQPADVTDEQINAVALEQWGPHAGGPLAAHRAFARAILALRPERVPMTERELELIDGMIAVQLDHAQRCDAISNRAMAEQHKGWDMERVELLRRIRSFGITAQAKMETPCSQPSDA